MKILFTTLNDHVPWGGSEELWSKVALFLSEDSDVTALIKKWNEEHPKVTFLRNSKVNLRYKNQKLNRATFLDKLKRKLSISPRNISKEEDYKPYDHVVISLGNNLDSTLIAITKSLISQGKDYSLIVQLATDLRHLTDEQIFSFLGAYQKAKNVFFLSEDNVLKTELVLGVKLSNKLKINNPFAYDQEYIAPQFNAFNMACVAAFTCFHKGQDVLITVLGQEKWKNRDFKLNLYGDGVNKNQIERLIDRYDLKSKVIIKGFVDNKEDIWLENTICILPSRMEGQSLAMLEAMSYGRMVIATNVGDAEQLIVEGVTGFLIPAPTIEMLDLALDKAWKARHEVVEMGLNSRRHLYKYIPKDPIEEFAKLIKKSI